MAVAALPAGFTLQARVRTAARDSQQNANVTFLDFNHNPVDTLKVSLDRFAAGWKRGYVSTDVGRMAFPFFTNNEYMWDADISPLGVAAGFQLPLAGSASLKLEGGGFALPVGIKYYSGHLYAAQAVFDSPHGTVAAGLFRFEADRNNPKKLLLLDDNGSRDYSVLAINMQAKLTTAGKPVAATADFYRNLQGYAGDPNPISYANRGQRAGYVLGVAWGDVAKPRHLQIGYRHFRMEKFATNSSYAHDDGARFGSPSQTDLTNVQGNDVYANYAIATHLTLGARAILSHRITNAEDDRRARFDVTYSF